uniref:AlNc14C470G11834 protein n=1 Tax=Albugo laibachii Nc14 TaxID=890382 RepID=F0X096_9STRA|nr:AlNc14C470G11834 [Albugo laibachii Nc14]|eukprot:CCA27178.1 AlNc14C470G11834 [Albugo laibachii Nc14]
MEGMKEAKVTKNCLLSNPNRQQDLEYHAVRDAIFSFSYNVSLILNGWTYPFMKCDSKSRKLTDFEVIEWMLCDQTVTSSWKK